MDIGLAADVGTLQRFPKIVGNDSLVRELCFTARKFFSDEAKQMGFVRYNPNAVYTYIHVYIFMFILIQQSVECLV